MGLGMPFNCQSCTARRGRSWCAVEAGTITLRTTGYNFGKDGLQLSACAVSGGHLLRLGPRTGRASDRSGYVPSRDGVSGVRDGMPRRLQRTGHSTLHIAVRDRWAVHLKWFPCSRSIFSRSASTIFTLLCSLAKPDQGTVVRAMCKLIKA